MGADNVEHPPIVIHRALLGSLERFIGILIEHYGGAFPFWLAPVQLRLIPVADPSREAVHELQQRLRPRVSESTSTNATTRSGSGSGTPRSRRCPYTIVYGDRESDASLAVRERGGEQSTMSLEELLERFRVEIATISA